MKFSNIIIIIIIIVIIYYIIRYFWYSNTVLISGINDATVLQTVDASSLAVSSTGSSATNFTYSIWFYISDWSYNYGKEKIIFTRSNDSTAIAPSPSVMLGATENNLIITQQVYNTTSTTSSTVDSTTGTTNFTCGVANVPLQKWVNFTVSIYGRSMDLYLDGKLVRSCVMPGTAKVPTSTPINVTPNGGFSGYTSKFQYYPNSINPQTAWNIYASGYSNSWSLFSSDYSVEISVYNGSTVEKTITL